MPTPTEIDGDKPIQKDTKYKEFFYRDNAMLNSGEVCEDCGHHCFQSLCGICHVQRLDKEISILEKEISLLKEEISLLRETPPPTVLAYQLVE